MLFLTFIRPYISRSYFTYRVSRTWTTKLGLIYVEKEEEKANTKFVRKQSY